MIELVDGLAIASLIGFAALGLMIVVALVREVRALQADLARADGLIDALRAANDRHIAGRTVAEANLTTTEATYLQACETIRVLEQRNSAQTQIIGHLVARLPVAGKALTVQISVLDVARVVDLGTSRTIVWHN